MLAASICAALTHTLLHPLPESMAANTTARWFVEVPCSRNTLCTSFRVSSLAVRSRSAANAREPPFSFLTRAPSSRSKVGGISTVAVRFSPACCSNSKFLLIAFLQSWLRQPLRFSQQFFRNQHSQQECE